MSKKIITLEDIKTLIEVNSMIMNQRFDIMEKRFNGIDDRLNAHREQIIDLKITVNQRFDQNDDGHQEIIGAIDEMCDRKIGKHCQEKHTFATS